MKRRKRPSADSCPDGAVSRSNVRSPFVVATPGSLMGGDSDTRRLLARPAYAASTGGITCIQAVGVYRCRSGCATTGSTCKWPMNGARLAAKPIACKAVAGRAQPCLASCAT